MHRDVTPQNVVVSFDGASRSSTSASPRRRRAKWRRSPARSRARSATCRPSSAAARRVDRRSDIFAVGIILFELTTGKRLYHERSDFDTLKKIIEGPVPSPRDLLPFYPAFLNAIVVRCLQKNADDRYQTARDLHADLDAFARDNQLVTGTVPLAQYMERIYADELATHKSADAAAMATAAQVTMTGSSSSYLGESSRRSSSPMATPLVAARRQHVMRLGLQAAIAVLLVVLGGGVVVLADAPQRCFTAEPRRRRAAAAVPSGAARRAAAPGAAAAPKAHGAAGVPVRGGAGGRRSRRCGAPGAAHAGACPSRRPSRATRTSRSRRSRAASCSSTACPTAPRRSSISRCRRASTPSCC